MTTEKRWRIILVLLLALTLLASVLMVLRDAFYWALMLAGGWAVVACTLAIRILVRERNQLRRGRFMHLLILVAEVCGLVVLLFFGWTLILGLSQVHFEPMSSPLLDALICLGSALMAVLYFLGYFLFSLAVGFWLFLLEVKRGRLLLGCVYLVLSFLCNFISLAEVASRIPAFSVLLNRPGAFWLAQLVPYAIWLFAEITYLLPRRTPGIKQKPQAV